MWRATVAAVTDSGDELGARDQALRGRREHARAKAARAQQRRKVLIGGLLAVVVLGGIAAGLTLAGSGDESPASGERAAGTQQSETVQTERPADASREPKAAASTPDWDRRNAAEWPLAGSSAQRTSVPILMYHLIAQAPAGTAYPELWVPPAEFRAHVRALDEAGFTGVTLDEVWDAWHGDGRLPNKPIVLSFDDGSYSQVLEAGPELLRAGWPGVLNLTTDHIGADGIPAWGVKRLMRQGWTVDSHTATHPDVTTLDAAGFTRELKGSRAEIKRRFGVEPRFLCYPAGRNDATSRAAVERAGYDGATTTEPGIAARGDDAFGLPRLRVDPGMSGAAVVKLASR